MGRGLRQWMAERKKKKEEELEERRRKRKMREWDRNFLAKYCTTMGVKKKQLSPSVRVERLPKVEDLMENAKMKHRRAMRRLGIEQRKKEVEKSGKKERKKEKKRLKKTRVNIVYALAITGKRGTPCFHVH